MIVSQKPMQRVMTWLRTGTGSIPRAVRAARRRQRHTSARRRSGSISAHMDAVVRDAVEGTRGSDRPGRKDASS
jgi:hypothetical protein